MATTKKKPKTRKVINAVMDQLMKEAPPLVRVKPGELVEGAVVFR